MNARTARQVSPDSGAPRFDRKFIEDHELVERYLQSKLPFRGARDLENWCREHPEFLNELQLSERTHASLKLLEASGQPQDLRERRPPWWKNNFVPLGLCIVTLFSLAALCALLAKYSLLRSEVENARALQHQGSLMPPATLSTVRVFPDRTPNAGQSRVAVNHGVAQLIDLRIGMGFSRDTQFRVTVDKRDQGRALVINNLTKDSNGDLSLAFNSSALAPGLYSVRIEALPFLGTAVPAGWLILDAR